MPAKKTNKKSNRRKGKLRIGNNWNAITIIALSQTNPLKAIAEFAENSIDAKARHITILRGREGGAHYLRISDDGEGIPRNEMGLPDFTYVATHICDSIKHQLKQKGAEGIQGEYGIGLLSFWTVGEELMMTSAGADGRNYQMWMAKGDPGYAVREKRTLLPIEGVDLLIKPLLPGVRQLSGEKIQWYLASELRDRIRSSGVQIKVIDRRARKEFMVEPREFTGRLLHNLDSFHSALGDVYAEIYLGELEHHGRVGLHRSGTRILEDITSLEIFNREPWSSSYLQGIIDASFLNLTPGTRSGVVHDAALQALSDALAPLEKKLLEIIEEQRRAEEERASARILRSVQKALKEALLALPAEEYDWFDVHDYGPQRPGKTRSSLAGQENGEATLTNPPSLDSPKQKQFFEFAGPLFSVKIFPQSCVLPVGETKTFRAAARDRNRKLVEENLSFLWEIVEGDGKLADTGSEIAEFTAAQEPGLVNISVTVTQGEVTCTGEALITVTESLLPESTKASTSHQGLPGYTYEKAPGELWRSRYDEEQNIIVINNGHRDYVFASKSKALKIRYISRLFAKELVCKNFKGIPPDNLLERMIELTLYMEENL
ncbi:MAG: ATP-binding protein [Thermodesulfobacteriota bacterium]